MRLSIRPSQVRVRIHQAVAFLSVSTTLAFSSPGCDPFSVGHFEGNLTQTVDGKNTIQPIGIDIEKGKKSAFLNIIGRKQELLTTLEVKDLESNSFSLKIPPVSSIPFRMNRLKKTGKCFVATETVRVDVCFEKDSFFVTVVDPQKDPIFILTADPFPKQEITPLEPNITIQLSDAIDRALNKNFQAQSEVENAFQAKKGAEEQYLNLLPHLTLGTILNLVEGALSPVSLVSSIGDLAPFLLPNRWLEAKEAGAIGEAAQIGKLLVQANLMAQVEGLAYVFERDRKILLIVDQTIEWLGEKGREVEKLEKKKELPANTFENYNALANNLKGTRASLAASLEISRSAFSNTLGYMNPEAIDFIDFGEESVTLDQAAPWSDKEELAVIAIQRSFELKQIHYVIKAAAAQKSQVYFTWLDPQASGTHSNLGFATGTRVEITASRIRDLNVKQTQVQSILRSSAYETVRSFNNAISAYHDEKGSYEKAGQRVETLISDILEKKTFDFDKTRAALFDFLEKITAEQSRLAAFRIARSKLDRLQLQGFYQRPTLKYLNQMTETGIAPKQDSSK